MGAPPIEKAAFAPEGCGGHKADVWHMAATARPEVHVVIIPGNPGSAGTPPSPPRDPLAACTLAGHVTALCTETE